MSDRGYVIQKQNEGGEERAHVVTLWHLRGAVGAPQVSCCGDQGSRGAWLGRRVPGRGHRQANVPQGVAGEPEGLVAGGAGWRGLKTLGTQAWRQGAVAAQ
jgi:hypothetical protein